MTDDFTRTWVDFVDDLDAEAMNDLEARMEARGSGVGTELDYAQITSNATRAATSYADIAGLSVTVTVATRPILVRFGCAGIDNSALNGGWSVALLEDGSVIGTVGRTANSANEAGFVTRDVRRVPAVGSHTYKAQLKTAFSGTTTIYADAGTLYGPAFVQVIQI